VILRYILGKPEDQAAHSARLIESDQLLAVTDVALAETAWTLLSLYHVPRTEMLDAISELLARENIDVFRLDKNIVLQGLELCRPSGRVSVGDALIWAAGRSESGAVIYTFDRRFPDQGITIRHPSVEP
jgi:predicted nucleic acid-binding protein